MTYTIEFTPLAKAFAGAKFSLAEVEAQARKELDELDCDPRKIFFHTVMMKDQDFICTPTATGVLIDTATYEETTTLDEGPLKGFKLMMPRQDSDR